METRKPSLAAPWSEIHHLRLFGEVVKPLNAKDADKEILIYADRSLLPLDRQAYKTPPAAGFFTYVGPDPKVFFRMPVDALPVVIQMHSAGRYKSLKFRGSENETGDPIVVRYEFDGGDEENPPVGAGGP